MFRLSQPHKTLKQLHGSHGEDIAEQFLIGQGYRILERNFYKRYGEIDIVAIEGETLVFVEVKTRYSRTFGKPEEAITRHKIHTLIRSSEYYLLTHAEYALSYRIDVVAIEMENDKSPSRISLIRNITL